MMWVMRCERWLCGRWLSEWNMEWGFIAHRRAGPPPQAFLGRDRVVFKDFEQVRFDCVANGIQRKVVDAARVKRVLQLHANPVERKQWHREQHDEQGDQKQSVI